MYLTSEGNIVDENQIEIFYPKWIKYLGIIGLPLLAIVAIWLATRFFLEPELTNTQKILSSILGVAVLYQCQIGARCLPYLNTIISLYDDGIDIYFKNQTNEYRWEDLTLVEYSFATTTQIKHKDGRTLAYLSEGLPNLDLLTSTINNENAKAW